MSMARYPCSIVDEHRVHVYASKTNDVTILKAPRPKDLFRNSIATPTLVASIINGKYTNALPLKRQSKVFKTNDLRLSTNTMANWVNKSTDVYLPLIYNRLHEPIYDNKVIHANESPVKNMRIDHAKIKIHKVCRSGHCQRLDHPGSIQHNHGDHAHRQYL